MVYYVCPNCGHRSAEYQQSMVHYNSCDVVRVRTVNSPPSSAFTGNTTTTMPGGAGPPGGGGAASAGGATAGGAVSATAQETAPETEQAK
ncbi:hypothetical protein JCM10450v2_004172 [Rhodotorula kratochvilovae]